MKAYKALININGSHSHQVVKKGLTAAEILVLRAIHGQDSVRDIKPMMAGGNAVHATIWTMDDDGNDIEAKLTRNTLLGSLRRVYGDQIVAAVFPGINPVLPVELAEIGENVDADEEIDLEKQALADHRAAISEDDEFGQLDAETEEDEEAAA
jgi:hypothetical protein